MEFERGHNARRAGSGIDGARARLLAGTALASTLLLCAPLAPMPAAAQQAVSILNSPNPATVNNAKDCSFAGNCIDISTINNGSFIDLFNSGDLNAGLAGIKTYTKGNSAPIRIENVGDISAGLVGIYAGAALSDITVVNRAAITATGQYAAGIQAVTGGANSTVKIVNSGDITTTGDIGVFGIGGHAILAQTFANNAKIDIRNSATLKTSGSGAIGIFGYAFGSGNKTYLMNSGDIITTDPSSVGMATVSQGLSGTDMMINRGSISSAGTGMGAFAFPGYGHQVSLINEGNIDANTGMTARVGGNVSIVNTGDITAVNAAIQALSLGPQARIIINNQGSARATGSVGDAINASSFDPGGSLGNGTLIKNWGTLFGNYRGIYSYSTRSTTIMNSGDISSGFGPVIQTNGARTELFNAGRITGNVDLTEQNDRFVNQAGGVFEARQTSLFGGGYDVFRNLKGATVHAAGNTNAPEMTSFINLERFENQGLISLQDGATGDSFTISNTPGGKNLNFIASGNSTLAVDAFLGGPSNSSSDTFTIQGNVSGVTTVAVNNTNNGPGVFNPDGIPVVFVTGNTPTGNEFSLAKPIDTGFFDYDLFFTPTGTGFLGSRSPTRAQARICCRSWRRPRRTSGMRAPPPGSTARRTFACC